VFISNFFGGIFPKKLGYFHGVDNQLVTRVFPVPFLHYRSYLTIFSQKLRFRGNLF
jgi:hypothetical protein